MSLVIRLSAMNTAMCRALLRRHAEEAPWIAVLEYPHRAVRRDGDVADAVPHDPSLRGRRTALAVERDAVQRLRRQAADERGSFPLREHGAVVEGDVARG